MMRTRPFRVSAFSVATLLVAALPALGQTPEAAPPPPPPPTPVVVVTPAPASPMVAMAAPKSPDDMTGSIGFGVGVIPGAQLVGTSGQVAIKYWMSDTLAVVPALNFNIMKSMGTSTAWAVNPEAVVLFAPFRTTSTRLLVGGGLGIGLAKTPPATDTAFRIYLPIQAGVEHFFTRWFSTGIAARTNLFDYTKQGSPYTMTIAINTASLLGSLFFYTD